MYLNQFQWNSVWKFLKMANLMKHCNSWQWVVISAFTKSDPIWPFHQFDSPNWRSSPNLSTEFNNSTNLAPEFSDLNIFQRACRFCQMADNHFLQRFGLTKLWNTTEFSTQRVFCLLCLGVKGVEGWQREVLGASSNLRLDCHCSCKTSSSYHHRSGGIVKGVTQSDPDLIPLNKVDQGSQLPFFPPSVGNCRSTAINQL